MSANLIVVEQLLAFLVEQGIAQRPEADPSTALPSVWLQSRQGAASPRRDDAAGWQELATITLNDTALQGPQGLEPWLEDTFVNVTVRSRNAGEGKLLHRAIRGLLAPVGERAGKKNWTMGALRVLYSNVWRQEQPLPPVEGGQTYDRVASYRFTCARSDLAS